MSLNLNIDQNYTKVPNELIRGSDLSSCDKVVAHYLLSLNFSGSGNVHPSIETIAAQVNLSPTTVKESLHELRDRKILAWRSGVFKSGRANEYQFLPRTDWITAKTRPPDGSVLGRQTATNKTNSKTNSFNKTEGEVIEDNSQPITHCVPSEGETPIRKRDSAVSDRYRLNLLTTKQEEGKNDV